MKRICECCGKMFESNEKELTVYQFNRKFGVARESKMFYSDRQIRNILNEYYDQFRHEVKKDGAVSISDYVSDVYIWLYSDKTIVDFLNRHNIILDCFK